MTVVLHSSELEAFIRQADLRQRHQRRAIAWKTADFYHTAEDPYREYLLTFRDPIAWASLQWLYRYNPDFYQVLWCNIHERNPGQIIYALFLEHLPREDWQAEGCLHVKPGRILMEQQS